MTEADPHPEGALVLIAGAGRLPELVAESLQRCAVLSWGEGDHGELGHGDRRSKPQPLCIKPFVKRV